jgi:hypothetical protein
MAGVLFTFTWLGFCLFLKGLSVVFFYIADFCLNLHGLGVLYFYKYRVLFSFTCSWVLFAFTSPGRCLHLHSLGVVCFYMACV